MVTAMEKQLMENEICSMQALTLHEAPHKQAGSRKHFGMSSGAPNKPKSKYIGLRLTYNGSPLYAPHTPPPPPLDLLSRHFCTRPKDRDDRESWTCDSSVIIIYVVFFVIFLMESHHVRAWALNQTTLIQFQARSPYIYRL